MDYHLKERIRRALGPLLSEALSRYKSQSAASKESHLQQPEVSRIVNGDYSNFAIEKMIGTLHTLGYSVSALKEKDTVTITIKPVARKDIP